MLPFDKYKEPVFRYMFALFCFILVGVMPAIAVPPEVVSPAATTVVRIDSRTGKLVRRAPAAGASGMTPDLSMLIDNIAALHGVEGPLVHSVILTESNYNPAALSPKGAQGLMQLIPSTAKRFGVTNSFNAAENIEGGVRYIRFLLDYYKGDYAKTIAAYNAGEAAVDKFNGIPPYPETRNYVYTVAHNLKAARARQSEKAETKLAAATPVNPDAPRPVIAFTGSDGKLYYKTP